MEEKELIWFEVETTYQCGRRRSELICSESEEKMWEDYYENHTSGLIKSSVIVDSWPQ